MHTDGEWRRNGRRALIKANFCITHDEGASRHHRHFRALGAIPKAAARRWCCRGFRVFNLRRFVAFLRRAEIRRQRKNQRHKELERV